MERSQMSGTSLKGKLSELSNPPNLQLSPSSMSLLFAAVDDGDADTVFKLLDSKMAYPNTCNKHGESPLHVAAGAGNLDIVQILCKHEANLEVTDKRGDTPLYWAARHGHLEVVRHLCSVGADVNSRDKAMETSLHVSARYDQFEVLSYLCQAGAQLDIPDEHGDTALLCGTWHGYYNVVECLVNAGSSLQRFNKDQETPLHVAAVRGYYTIVQFFCERGANLNARDKLGCTPLHLATRRSRTDVVQYLCKRNCDLNIQNMNGDTALHDACREGELQLFHALMEAKCQLDIPNLNKCTPLHLAAKYGHNELVRHLCVDGASVHARNKDGKTPDVMAYESSDSELAALLNHLRQDCCVGQYVADMVPGQLSIGRVKLFVCGATGVGKTELVKSLKCRLLRSLFRKRSNSNLSHMIQQRTHGIMVHQARIPNAGTFSVWDFSGLESYYILHEGFLSATNALVLLVFKANDPPEQQLSQLRFWLSLFKAKQKQSARIRFAGKIEHKPRIVVVGSFANLPYVLPEGEGGTLTNPPAAPTAATLPDPRKVREVFDTIKEEYREYFTFSEQLFLLDSRLSQTIEIKDLRVHLGALRSKIVQSQPKTSRFVGQLSEALPEWREEYSSFPVFSWPAFLDRVRQYVNPLVSETTVVDAVSTLNVMGEIVYSREKPLCNIVILDPMWLGLRFFGPALSPENSIIPQLKSITGYINLSTLQRVYPELDPASTVSLFEHFELCIPVDNKRMSFLFPCLIKMEPIHGLWEKAEGFTVYAGVRVTCQSVVDIFSPSVFPKIQILSRRTFCHDIEDQELTLWRGGLKCCRGEVEVMLRYPEPGKCIEIVVRGAEVARLECYMLMQQFYTIVTETVHRVDPGTAFMTEMLSPRRLQEHKPVLWYSPEEMFAAERGEGVLQHAGMPGQAEEMLMNVVCCGCEELLMATKSAPYTLTSDLPLLTRRELSRLLDPMHPLGRDWCLLSLQLLFTDDVPNIDKAGAHGDVSPTDRLLMEWEESIQSNVVAVIDALRSIGREDAACTLIRGLSPFSNPSSSVVISIADVPLTSYLC